MWVYECGSPVCSKRLAAPTHDELMAQVGAHVARKHHVPRPSKSLVQFIEENTIREVAS